MPTFGSLFAGIGGLDLGLERAGWTCRWQVEIDPFCQRVLAKHWPNVTRYGDIKALDLERVERVDLICGGFPCQPVSVAGKRLAQADARWLWPEFSRIVRALRPRLVLVENVPGLLVRGFGDVVGDLAACGYDAEWDCIPASALSAPHRRDRVWLVAYADHLRRDYKRFLGGTPGEFSGGTPRFVDEGSSDVADAARDGRLARGPGDPAQESGGREPDRSGVSEALANPESAKRRQPQARDRGRVFAGAGQTSGFTDHWAIEPDVGRVAHGVPARVDRLRGLGNAVVPQVAEWIGRRLMVAR